MKKTGTEKLEEGKEISVIESTDQLKQSFNLPDDYRYDATTSAVPKEIIQRNFDKIKQGKLHPKRQGQSIRREMTERRISNNIMMYNSAVP